ncbi:MAG: hypothetical protein ACTHKB_15665 [Burkholderiaceae bacterium]
MKKFWSRFIEWIHGMFGPDDAPAAPTTPATHHKEHELNGKSFDSESL